MHEHNLTPHSLYTAVLVGLETETIIAVLSKLSKTKLPKEMIDFIHASTANYRKVKFILKKNWYFIKSPFLEVLKRLLADEAIEKAGILSEGMHRNDGFTVSKPVNEIEGGHDELINEVYVAAAAEEKETHSFEIDPAQVENVKQRCLPNALNYLMIGEYDFRNDTWMISIDPSRFEFHNGGLLLIWPSWLIILILKNDLIYKRKNGVNLILSSDSPLQVSQFLRTLAMQNWQTYLQLLVFASESGTCFTR